MTPAEALDRLGFSPLLQAIGGLVWFSLVIGLMMRAEYAKKQGPVSSGAPAAPAAPASGSAPEHMARVFELMLAANEAQRQTCIKIMALNTKLAELTESFRIISAVREKQIDELITAVKENSRRLR